MNSGPCVLRSVKLKIKVLPEEFLEMHSSNGKDKWNQSQGGTEFSTPFRKHLERPISLELVGEFGVEVLFDLLGLLRREPQD